MDDMALFSATERNIISSLKIPPNFKSEAMVEGLKIDTSIEHVGSGVPNLKGYREVTASFASTCYVTLCHNRNDMLTPAPGTLAYRDYPQIRRRLEAAFSNMSAAQCKSSLFISVAEKLSSKPEVRSMMLKGYLYLCDMVLSTSCRGMQLFVSNSTVDRIKCSSEYDALCSMDRYSVYAREDRFSNLEYDLFCLLCCKFPKVKFSEEDNIYNSFVIPAEDAAVQVREERNDREVTIGIDSPELFLETLTQLACKMECLDQLFEVISDFRGLPYFLNNIGKHWPRCSAYILNYPRSRSLSMALLTGVDCSGRINIQSNFMATTMSVVADNLMGQCLVSSFFTFGEHLGAFGLEGCPSGKPQSDPLLTSRCHEHGIDSEDYRVNDLRHEWQLMKGRDLPLCFGGELRHVFCSYIQDIRSKKHVNGMFSPCLLMDIAESRLKETTWGICRGFEAKERVLCVPRRVYDVSRKHAFCWVNGQSDVRPVVGLSLLGDENPYTLDNKENRFLANCQGLYSISKVTRSLASNHELPKDMMMENMTLFGAYRGGRTTMVFGRDNAVRIINEIEEEVLADRARTTTGRQSTRAHNGGGNGGFRSIVDHELITNVTSDELTSERDTHQEQQQMGRDGDRPITTRERGIYAKGKRKERYNAGGFMEGREIDEDDMSDGGHGKPAWMMKKKKQVNSDSDEDVVQLIGVDKKNIGRGNERTVKASYLTRPGVKDKNTGIMRNTGTMGNLRQRGDGCGKPYKPF